MTLLLAGILGVVYVSDHIIVNPAGAVKIPVNADDAREPVLVTLRE